MTKEKSNPQSPEEMAKTAQEAAVKSAMEQAQAMFGNIPGFQMPGGMQEQIMTQMGSGVPDMAEIQAQRIAGSPTQRRIQNRHIARSDSAPP